MIIILVHFGNRGFTVTLRERPSLYARTSRIEQSLRIEFFQFSVNSSTSRPPDLPTVPYGEFKAFI